LILCHHTIKIIMKTAWLCVTVIGCFVMKTTNATLGSAWTTPTINTINGTGAISLAENAALPKLVATGATTYAIVTQTPAGILNINTTTGQLTLVAGKKLDFETAPKHVLVVKVGDGDTSASATITITVTDVKEPPVFTMSKYSTCVVDKAKQGTSVLTVTTTDEDGNTGVNVISTMDITVGDTNSFFTIANNGTITLAKAVDMETTAKYNLTVTATDSDPGTKLIGTTSVIVTIAGKCGGSGVGILAASLLTMLVGVMTSLSSL